MVSVVVVVVVVVFVVVVNVVVGSNFKKKHGKKIGTKTEFSSSRNFSSKTKF